MKKVIMAAVAAAFVSGAAQAAIITNGGNPEYSLTDIQSKVDNGEWPRYPYVAGTGVTAYNTLFANTFEDGRVLPQFHDVIALQRAIKDKGVVLVADASNGVILPCPAVFKELGRQNGVTCYRFMEHYVTSTTDIDNDAFGEHARAMTQAIIETVAPQTAAQTELLIDAGVDESMALRVALNAANAEITKLTAQQQALVAEIVTLKRLHDEASAAWATVVAEREATIAQKQAVINDLRNQVAAKTAQIEAANLTIANLNADIVTKNSQISNLENNANALQTALDNARSTAANQIATRDSNIQMLTTALTEANEAKARFWAERDQARRDLNAANETLAERTRERDGLQTMVNGLSTSYAELQRNSGREIAQLNADLATANMDLQAAANTITRLRSANESLAAQLRSTADVQADLNAINHRIAQARASAALFAANQDAVARTVIASRLGDSSQYNPAQSNTHPTAHVSSNGAISGGYINGSLNDGYIDSGDFVIDVEDLVTTINAVIDASYDAGYTDGYNDGYADGFRDGVESVTE